MLAFSIAFVSTGRSCTIVWLFFPKVRLEGISSSRLLLSAVSSGFAVLLVSMSTVSPIIPSIEPDSTSLTVSVMDDEGLLTSVCWLDITVFGVVRLGWEFGVVRLGWEFGVVRLGWEFGVVRLGWEFGVVRLGWEFGVVRLGWEFGVVRLGWEFGVVRLG